MSSLIRSTSPLDPVINNYRTNLRNYNKILRQSIKNAKKNHYTKCFSNIKSDMKSTEYYMPYFYCYTANHSEVIFISPLSLKLNLLQNNQNQQQNQRFSSLKYPASQPVCILICVCFRHPRT